MGSAETSQALYRTHRSRRLEDVVGQTHITDTLQQALAQNRVRHAYLFTGPRGVGKTSVARILAHAVNDLNYDGSVNHIDIIEIDAASNRGIDEIRELRDKAHIAPTTARFKVYIIDEVHMLTTPAFNALLKILEEPPAHVIFILATTEVHKVPPTITSRTQRFAFNAIADTDIAQHLAKIAKTEGISADRDALELIARHAHGSLRDALSLLDQISARHSDTIKAKHVEAAIGLAPGTIVNTLLAAVDSGDTAVITQTLEEARSRGIMPGQLSQQLIDAIRDSSSSISADRLELIESLLNVNSAYDQYLTLFVGLSRHALSAGRRLQNSPDENRNSSAQTDKTSSATAASTSQPAKKASKQTSAAGRTETNFEAKWQEALNTIKTGNNSLYAVLRLARPELAEQQTLRLEFRFNFHAQRLNETKNQEALLAALTKAGSEVARIETRVATADTQQRADNQESRNQDTINQVISVMGGGNLVEYDDE